MILHSCFYSSRNFSSQHWESVRQVLPGNHACWLGILNMGHHLHISSEILLSKEPGTRIFLLLDPLHQFNKEARMQMSQATCFTFFMCRRYGWRMDSHCSAEGIQRQEPISITVRSSFPLLSTSSWFLTLPSMLRGFLCGTGKNCGGVRASFRFFWPICRILSTNLQESCDSCRLSTSHHFCQAMLCLNQAD